MNPFVNPKKRSITLPNGCKDLADVFKRSEPKQKKQVNQFIRLLLFQAAQDRAAELVISVALPKGGTPIRYKMEDGWHDLEPFPSHIRPAVISELARMVKFPAGQVSGEGVLDLGFGDRQPKWMVTITSANAECRLVRIQTPDEN